METKKRCNDLSFQVENRQLGTIYETPAMHTGENDDDEHRVVNKATDRPAPLQLEFPLVAKAKKLWLSILDHLPGAPAHLVA